MLFGPYTILLVFVGEKARNILNNHIKNEVNNKIDENKKLAIEEAHKEAFSTISNALKKSFQELISKIIILLLPFFLYHVNFMNKEISIYALSIIYLGILGLFIKNMQGHYPDIKSFIFKDKFNIKKFVAHKIYSKIVKEGRIRAHNEMNYIKSDKIQNRIHKTITNIAFKVSNYNKDETVEQVISTVAKVASEITTNKVLLEALPLFVKTVLAFISYIVIFRFIIGPFLVDRMINFHSLNIIQLTLLPTTISIDRILGTSITLLIV